LRLAALRFPAFLFAAFYFFFFFASRALRWS
jgi:hypothetical protein